MKQLVRYLTLLCFAVALNSCKKSVPEPVPCKCGVPEAPFATAEKILAEVNNLYSTIKRPGFYGGRQILFNEQRGDEFNQRDLNPILGASIWNQDAHPDDDLVNDVWLTAYAAIKSSNNLILGIANSTVISPVLRDQYIGEAKFIRAFCYFSLVQTFAQPFAKDKGASAGLPLRLQPVTAATSQDLLRSKVVEVYAQIIKDLGEAETALPDSWETVYLNSLRVHKASAIALKTRVFLTMGDYVNVVKEAKKIVSTLAPYQYNLGNMSHRLEPNVASLYTGTYVGPESIFSLAFDETNAPDAQSSLAMYYAGVPVLALNASGVASNMSIRVGGVSKDARNLLVLLTIHTEKGLAKFMKITPPYTDFIPVIRYAEVLLNYAEASAELNNLGYATSLLNAVRHRSYPGYVFKPDEISTRISLVNTILAERRLELMGEGFRVNDLQRRLQPLPYKIAYAATAPAVEPNAYNYIWPIPSSEIANNKLIWK